MRPVRIEVEGFSTFRSSTVVEFDDVDLVAFVGPTGSGKSTIIDALTFALYGSVARYGDARLVAPVIHQGSNEARVRLDFELAGQTYTAVRVVRRTKTGATTKEARLERLSGVVEGTSPVMASSAKDVTREVEALLGLDFTQFTRTVVLPQGEFAKFLKDEPADRQELLSRLLDLGLYGRMGSKARERAKAAGQKAELLDQQIAQRSEVDAAAVQVAEQRVADIAGFAAVAAGKLEEGDAIEAELVGLRGAVGELDRSAEALRTVMVPVEITELASRADQAATVLTECDAALAAARVERDEAEEQLRAAGDPVTLRTQLDAHERIAALSIELEPLAEERTSAADQLVVAEQALHEAAATAEATARSLSAARQGADAAQWVAALVPGEACPVCRQIVADLPDHDASRELADAERASAAAAEVEASARKKVNELAAMFERLGSRFEDRQAERDRLLAVLDAASDATGGPVAVSAIETALAAIATLTAEANQARKNVKQAEAALAAAAAEAKAVNTIEADARRAFSDQRDAVAALSPPSAGSSLAVDWATLEAWANEQLIVIGQKRDEVGAAGRRLADDKKALLDELAVGAAPLGIGTDDLRSELVRAATSAEATLDRLRERLSEKQALVAQAAELVEERQVNEQLGRLLSATGFERWLLSEALEDLVERATGRLFELSNGQFSLAAHDTSFAIVDHRNANQERDVRTLSGGETFLASLALALALSDSIAELAPVDSPRLGSMFLDEGFGTLDPETLDLVAGAIEELSASGRLVGIVTHIEALAERMPVRFEVRKGPVTSTVEKVSA